tara:strand:+ start:123394 stop:127017 length:3624 start_codon:yes stop_codon:yes gene_type:complete
MMVSKGMENIARMLIVAAAAAMLQSGGVYADDTEIYRTTPVADSRAQVLIIFDDSGSMTTVVEGQRPPYDNTLTTYANTHPSDRVYWSTDGAPPVVNSNDYFVTGSNRCATSYTPLQNNGFFPAGAAARWFPGGMDQFCFEFNGNELCFDIPGGSAGWTALSVGSHNPQHIDCAADILTGEPSNGPGIADGYPQNTSTDGQEYGLNSNNPPAWGSDSYTFFSAHYMNWYHDTSLRDDQTRLEIAQNVVSNLVEASTQIDFGLMLFNENSGNDIADDYNGGRVVQRLIPNMSSGPGSDRENYTNIINGTIADGLTPLCETTMEAYRYLSGDPVVYGMERNAAPIAAVDPNSPLNGLPHDPRPRDTLAESPIGTYSSPLTECASTYIILMTDGRPTFDLDANSAIEALTGKTCQDYPSDHGDDRKNCLPEIAEYMAQTDLDGDSSNGDQHGITYTIGFATDQQLLSDTARNGKGKYATVENARQLGDTFRGFLGDILSKDSSFTSPVVAVDTFTRTESRNEVFFAMFTPETTADWPGNIKRLNIDFSSGDGVFVDKDGVAAIDPATGEIKASATTEWSTTQDGPSVLEGGVGALLAARDPATRNIYSNTGTSEALQTYEAANMTAAAFGYGSDADLYNLGFGVSNQLDFQAAIDWGRGFDLFDDDKDDQTDDARPWILGDMLHSKPLIVNYGARGSFTPENPDLRIVAGTNAGFLHMFSNDDGQEDWAFFAKELAPLLNIRRVNAVSSQHPYGIDAPAVVYTLDVDRDGTIDSTEGDKAYLYFGLRRGGRILYALDISNPDSPAMLWRKDASSIGFSELGQTWSVPVLTKIPGYKDNQGVRKPVLVFGAGYDTNKDSPGLATADAIGRGIFIIDAATGALVWSVTPAANSATNMQEAELLHSVPAGVTVLDSNGDNLTDRIYFADTGGQLWRVDLPGDELPDSSQETWRIVKVASVNGGTRATDRRFFNAPDIVRTVQSGKAFDAILIGSGDRTNPNDMDDANDPNLMAVDNQFYMFRDQATNPYFTAEPSTADCGATPPSNDFRCQLPLDPNDLYDVTANTIEFGDTEEQTAAENALAAANGWRLDLQGNGEKALASSIVVSGRVYLTTFTPDSGVVNVCVPIPGTGKLYVLNLYDTTERLTLALGDILPDTITPHFRSDGQIGGITPMGCKDCGGSGSGSGEGGGDLILFGESFPRPRGTYWFREEY